MTHYRLFADLIVFVHGLWVAVVVFGLLAVLLGAAFGWQWVRNAWFRLIHFGMITVVVAESLLNIPCPLTVWERELRKAAGETVREATFIGRFVNELIFVDVPSFVLNGVYCLFGAVVLATLILVPPRLPASWLAFARRGRAHVKHG